MRRVGRRGHRRTCGCDGASQRRASSSVESCLGLRRRRDAAVSVAEAISTVNGSPTLRAPTPTRGVAQAGVRQHGAGARSSLNPRRRSPSLVADPLFAMLAQIEHQHAAARHGDARRFGDRARRVRGVVQRLRQQRDVDRRVLDRQLLELAALPHDVRRRGGGGPAPGPGRARLSERSTAMTRRRPARRFDRRDSRRRSRDRRPSAAAAAGRARATTPPSSGRARTAARRARRPRRGRRSSLSAAAALPAAAPRRPARRRRRPRPRTAP